MSYKKYQHFSSFIYISNIKYQLLFKRKSADIQRPHKPNCTTVPSISLLSAFWGLSESKRKQNSEVPVKWLEINGIYPNTLW